MLVLLVIIPLIFITISFQNQGKCWRNSILLTVIFLGTLLTLITEALSLFRCVNLVCIALTWFLISILSIFNYLKHQSKQLNVPSDLTKIFIFRIKSAYILIGSIVFNTTIIALIALVAPPNTWDSMTYHMSRVAHWIQNASVAHYPTNITRQLDSSPWAEFAIMHLQILWGGDRLANLIQWFSMLSCLIGISLIAKELGANWYGQAFSSVICVTIPMGILQASSTQNDYVVSLWLVCFAYYILLAVKYGLELRNSLIIGASLGLAILSKGTAYIYAVPFIFWLLTSIFKNTRWKTFKYLFFIGISTLIINISFWLRNFELYKSPLGISGKITINETFTFQGLLSNFIKNLSLHLIVPIQIINDLQEKIIYQIHGLIGISINDVNTNFKGIEFHVNNAGNDNFFLHEDFVGNFIHLLMTFALILVCVTTKKNKIHNYLIESYFITVFFTFIFFNLLLKWQPWGSRLQLPIFVLFSAFIGTVFANKFNYKLVNIVTIILVLLCQPFIFFNASRPLILNGHFTNNLSDSILNANRLTQYFSNNLQQQELYVGAMNFINNQGCYNVGLLINEDSWEYPFWVIAQNNGQPRVYFEHVNISNLSSAKIDVYPHKTFIPCAIISVDQVNLNKILAKQYIFTQVWSMKSVSVFTLKQ